MSGSRPKLASRGRVVAHYRRKQGRDLSARMSAFHELICRDPCAMCSSLPVTPEVRRKFSHELVDRQLHHIIRQEHLKALGRRLGIDYSDLVTDERNGMCLCGYHHPRHTHYVERVPRRLLPEAVYEFAAEHHIDWLLDKEYPLD